MPKSLDEVPFSVRAALTSGVRPGRLRRLDLLIPTSGVRYPAGKDPSRLHSIRAHVEATRGIASHAAAASFLGLPLPGNLSDRMDISVPKGRDAPDRPGVHGHALTLFPGETILVDGTPVTSPARTFLDLAALLREKDLVALGDAAAALGRRPWSRQDVDPVSPEMLRRYLGWKRGTPGIRKARRAAELVCDGVDSPPETFLRLAFSDAGLPSFTPDFPVTDSDGVVHRNADLGNAAHRIVLEYDGEHHRTPEQQRSDARRKQLYQELGWRNAVIVADDLRSDCAPAVDKVRRLLRSPAQMPTGREFSLE